MINLKRTLRYVNRFGWRAGWQATRLHGPQNAVVAVQLPGFAHPFWARTGTSDVATFDEVFMAREYELPFADFSPAHILDLGANVGYASLCFAARWPRAHILAVEPDAGNFRFLTRNTQAWARITPLHAAVWAHPTRVVVANPDAAPNALRMCESAGTATGDIEAFTVAQLIEHTGRPRVDLLKMDVEGAEAAILSHSADWLDRVDVLVIELHDRMVPGCAEALCHALRGRRFHQEIVGANLAIDLRRPPADFPPRLSEK